MRANFVHIEHQLRATLEAGIPGDLAEFGVWYATTFMPMAELARQAGRTIHAVDSFCGMVPNTDRDNGEYQKGALSVNGSATFRMLARPFGSTIVVHEGFVPAVLDEMADCRFAFVHLDLDQYLPSLQALRFVWPRMSSGGIMICHDYFPDRNTLAAGAIHDWMAETATPPLHHEPMSRHAWFVKE